MQKDVAVKVLKDQGLQRVKADLENEIAVLKYVRTSLLRETCPDLALYRSLRHPNCVLFIGYSVNPFFYIVTGAHTLWRTQRILILRSTEFMSQGSLYDILHNPVIRLTSSQQVKITIEIALAMNYLHVRLSLCVPSSSRPDSPLQQHSPQVLHRDLKSSNVLINESWAVKVSDFGLAELRGALQLPQVWCVSCRSLRLLSRALTRRTVAQCSGAPPR